MRTLLALGLMSALCAGPAFAAERCTPIRFERGQSSAVVKGAAPAETTACYSLATGAGQTARLKILSGENTVFTIDGLFDARDEAEFKTQSKTYRILVGQLMRATGPEAFSLSVAVQ